MGLINNNNNGEHCKVYHFRSCANKQYLSFSVESVTFLLLTYFGFSKCVMYCHNKKTYLFILRN